MENIETITPAPVVIEELDMSVLELYDFWDMLE